MNLTVRRTHVCVKSSAALRALFVSITIPAAFALSGCGGMRTVSAQSKNATLSKDQITAIIANPDRSAADRNNDARRKPEQMLAFIGVRPGMVAEDLFAGGGYTTELLARAVGPAGRVYGQRPLPRNPNTPPPQNVTPEGGSAPAAVSSSMMMTPPAKPVSVPQTLVERAKNPAVANIVPVLLKLEEPVPPEVAAGGLDLVTLMFNYHDLGYMDVDRAQMNKALFSALKSGGIYVIADHAGRPGTGISEAGTLHRIDENFLRKEIEAAGFKLVDEAYFLRNPSDPRDKNTPEPPQPKDDFVLKFIKP